MQGSQSLWRISVVVVESRAPTQEQRQGRWHPTQNMSTRDSLVHGDVEAIDHFFGLIVDSVYIIKGQCRHCQLWFNLGHQVAVSDQLFGD